MGNFHPNTRGAIFMMLSMAGFVLNDTMMKLVLNELPLFQSIVIRGAFACAFMTLLCWYMGALKNWRRNLAMLRHPKVIWRSIGEVGGTLFFLTALNHMPIANITAVLQILPLTITLGAAWFFGEAVGWRRYIAIIVGLLGVLLIIKPGGADFNIFAIYAVIATLFITMRDLVTRDIPGDIPSLFVSLVTSICVLGLGFVGSIFEDWGTVKPDHLVKLGGAAAILMVGYICSILAMRHGEVSFVAPFRYSILIWALLLGFVIFNETPDGLALIGAVIVVGSGLFTFYRERLLKKTVVRASK